jgi:hypothetical protein
MDYRVTNLTQNLVSLPDGTTIPIGGFKIVDRYPTLSSEILKLISITPVAGEADGVSDPLTDPFVYDANNRIVGATNPDGTEHLFGIVSGPGETPNRIATQAVAGVGLWSTGL